MLYDDRDARPGVKFADAELLGIPHRVVVGERGLEAGKLEYRHRRDTESQEFALDDALAFHLARGWAVSVVAASRRRSRRRPARARSA